MPNELEERARGCLKAACIANGRPAAAKSVDQEYGGYHTTEIIAAMIAFTQEAGWMPKIEVVRDIDVPAGAWPWIEEIAKAADGPHRQIETPKDAETIVFWHNERPAAFVLNLRDQFNYSVQYRVDLRKLPLPAPPALDPHSLDRAGMAQEVDEDLTRKRT